MVRIVRSDGIRLRAVQQLLGHFACFFEVTVKVTVLPTGPTGLPRDTESKR